MQSLSLELATTTTSVSWSGSMQALLCLSQNSLVLVQKVTPMVSQSALPNSIRLNLSLFTLVLELQLRLLSSSPMA
jgi:hypothetical protein